MYFPVHCLCLAIARVTKSKFFTGTNPGLLCGINDWRRTSSNGRAKGDPVLSLTDEQFDWLLRGLDIAKLTPHTESVFTDLF